MRKFFRCLALSEFTKQRHAREDLSEFWTIARLSYASTEAGPCKGIAKLQEALQATPVRRVFLCHCVDVGETMELELALDPPILPE